MRVDPLPQSFTSLHFHVIFSTKKRAPFLADDVRTALFRYMNGILNNQNGNLMAIGGTMDHVQLLIGLHPSKALADVIRDVKASSSGWIHDTFPSLRHFNWQAGYGAFSVSRSNIEQVRGYIASQEEHHKVVSFEEEYEEFLMRHQINFEKRYLWQDS